MVRIVGKPDDTVAAVAEGLKEFDQAHEHADCAVYRYNPAAIRVRIIDSVFHGRSLGERHDYAMRYLRRLPEDVLAEISILLCLEPGEHSFLDLEFSDPVPSKL